MEKGLIIPDLSRLGVEEIKQHPGGVVFVEFEDEYEYFDHIAEVSSKLLVENHNYGVSYWSRVDNVSAMFFFVEDGLSPEGELIIPDLPKLGVDEIKQYPGGVVFIEFASEYEYFDHIAEVSSNLLMANKDCSVSCWNPIDDVSVMFLFKEGGPII
jgi:hypothetical protein